MRRKKSMRLFAVAFLCLVMVLANLPAVTYAEEIQVPQEQQTETAAQVEGIEKDHIPAKAETEVSDEQNGAADTLEAVGSAKALGATSVADRSKIAVQTAAEGMAGNEERELLVSAANGINANTWRKFISGDMYTNCDYSYDGTTWIRIESGQTYKFPEDTTVYCRSYKDFKVITVKIRRYYKASVAVNVSPYYSTAGITVNGKNYVNGSRCDIKKGDTLAVNPLQGYSAVVTLGGQILTPENGVYTAGTVTQDTDLMVQYQRNVKLTPKNVEVAYGEEIPTDFSYEFTYENTGEKLSEYTQNRLNCGNVSVSTDARKGSPVIEGGYDLTASYDGTEVNNWYHIICVPGTLTVTPMKVNVSIDAKQKTEGEQDPALTYHVTKAEEETGLQADGAEQEADDLGLVLTREKGETPGHYDIYIDKEASKINPSYEIVSLEQVNETGKDKFEIVKGAAAAGVDPTGTNDTNGTPPTDNGDRNKPAKSAKTGDTSDVILYAGVMIMAFAAMTLTAGAKRRRR